MKTIFFGGAFDPFHSQHKVLIVGAKNELQADRVIVYPSFSPPHKENPGTTFDIRFEMVKRGTEDLPFVIVDPIERDRGIVNYSYEVIPLLKKKYPSDEYCFLIGGDSMVNFEKWVHPEIICKEIALFVAQRSNVSGLDAAIARSREKYNAKIVLLDVEGEPVSSSQIKARAELGLPQVDISPEVEKVLINHGLYREFSDIVAKLKSSIPEKTFMHVSRTVLYALKLNMKLNLPYRKVFTACLLHDCTKHIKTEMEGVPAPVVHQYTGADTAKEEYGVTDNDVLSAIRFHTTGKPDMSELEKLVYCADMLEEGRTYPGVEELRKTIEEDFQEGFLCCVKSSLKNLIASQKPIDPLTKACASYYTII